MIRPAMIWAQTIAQDIGRGQGVRRGGTRGLGHAVADDQRAGHIRHGLVDLLCNSNADGDQDDKGNIKEYGDGQQKA